MTSHPVGVTQHCRGARLTPETFGRLFARNKSFQQEFDGNLVADVAAARAVDGTHSTLA
jgi:hypothetical protein